MLVPEETMVRDRYCLVDHVPAAQWGGTGSVNKRDECEKGKWMVS